MTTSGRQIMHTRTEHWQRWARKCALGLCPDDTRHALQSFIASRFQHYRDTYALHMTSGRTAAMPVAPHEAWHGFETWLRLRNTRQGKVYKLWLLAHAGLPETPDLSRLESAASLMVRDVVRDNLRREFSPPFMVSMDAPLERRTDDAGPSLADLIPAAPTEAAEHADLQHLAAAETQSVLRGLARRHRLALLARELGLPLSHPAVLRVAGCGKSHLAAAHGVALRSMAAHIQVRYPGEPPSTRAEMAILLLEHVRAAVVAWGRLETGCADFFRLSASPEAVLKESAPPGSGVSHAN